MAHDTIVNRTVYFWACEKDCNSKAVASIDLSNLQSHASGGVRVAYDPTRFGAAKIRVACASVKRGEIVALVFSTGKVILPGVTSDEEARLAVDEIVRWLSSVLGKTMEARDVKTPNVVGKCKGDPIDLEAMSRALGSEIVHREPDDPGTFSPCFVRPSEGPEGVLYLVSASGEIVVTGCQSEEALNESMREAQKMCADFRSRAE